MGALGAAPAAPIAAQEEGRTVADAPSRKVIRTKRMRVPADLFERDAVFFKRAGRGRRHDPGRRTQPRPLRHAAGATASARQKAPAGRAASARSLPCEGCLKGNPSVAAFIAAAGSPKAACWVGDTDVTQWLLSQGWAELAEGVTDETYAEAAAFARRRKAGIWGDGPPPAGQNMEQLHLNVARLDRVITGGLPPAPQLRCTRQVSPAARNREQSASATWRLPASIRMRVQIGAAFILTVVVRITLG